MQLLYKTTLLITMAVVTWKVVKIESYLKPKTIDISLSKSRSNQYQQTRRFLNSLSKAIQNDIEN
ncbi:hypothetical protein BUY49_11055 [Staphylococcus devriesei]|uniref:hypothetical protein n=1 Tax=Staphylococcus devriesei TaxID=586733 RepID=UPI000E6862BB|nr:hypothetical protein [Staphylococcus devriesei]RIL69632.1 hypothetical protein BUY49_11055 [Staphylococcus devriesei]